MTTFECLTGYNPFYDPNILNTGKNIVKQKIDWDNCPQINQISKNAKNFLKLLLKKSPDERPDAATASGQPRLQSCSSCLPCSSATASRAGHMPPRSSASPGAATTTAGPAWALAG